MFFFFVSGGAARRWVRSGPRGGVAPLFPPEKRAPFAPAAAFSSPPSARSVLGSRCFGCSGAGRAHRANRANAPRFSFLVVVDVAALRLRLSAGRSVSLRARLSGALYGTRKRLCRCADPCALYPAPRSSSLAVRHAPPLGASAARSKYGARLLTAAPFFLGVEKGVCFFSARCAVPPPFRPQPPSSPRGQHPSSRGSRRRAAAARRRRAAGRPQRGGGCDFEPPISRPSPPISRS